MFIRKKGIYLEVDKQTINGALLRELVYISWIMQMCGMKNQCTSSLLTDKLIYVTHAQCRYYLSALNKRKKMIKR